MDWLNSITSRTFVLAGLTLVIPLIAIAVALVYLQRIHDETREIATVDIPITKAVTEITVATLEQEILLERALALSMQTPISQSVTERFDSNRQKFFNKSAEIKHLFETTTARLEDLIAEEATSAAGRQFTDLNRVLKNAEKLHVELVSYGTTLLGPKGLSDHVEFEALSKDVERVEDSLDFLLVGALRQVEEFTENSALQTEQIERDAINVVFIVSTAAILFATIISIIMGRSITTPIIRASSNIGRLNTGDTETELSPVPSSLIEIQALDEGIAQYRDTQIREHQISQQLEQKANELEEALDRQLEVNTLLKDFVTMAAHEFRTPLAIIDASAQRMTSQFASNEQEDGELNERISSIRNNVTRLSGLIDGTLEAARIESDALIADKSWFSLRELSQGIAIHHNELGSWDRVQVEPTFPPVEIYADRAMIDRVINNLVSNGIKYGDDDGHVKMTARLGNGKVYFSVTDTGPGIEPDDAVKIFDKYFRGKNSGGTAGTGLGLNTCRKLIELHGGQIWAERMTDTSGTRFAFTLNEWRHTDRHGAATQVADA